MHKEPQTSKCVLLFTYQFLRIISSATVTKNIGNSPCSPAGSATSWLGKGLWLHKSTKFWVIPNPRVSFSCPTGKKSHEAFLLNKGIQADRPKLISFKTISPTSFCHCLHLLQCSLLGLWAMVLLIFRLQGVGRYQAAELRSNTERPTLTFIK